MSKPINLRRGREVSFFSEAAAWRSHRHWTGRIARRQRGTAAARRDPVQNSNPAGKIEELKPDSDPPIRQSPATIASPVPQSAGSSSRLSPPTTAMPGSPSHKVSHSQTMDLQSGAESEDESEDEEQDEADPRHDHHADLDELFGPHDPCYDPAAKLVARLLRLKHNVAYLQRQRGRLRQSAAWARARLCMSKPINLQR